MPLPKHGGDLAGSGGFVLPPLSARTFAKDYSELPFEAQSARKPYREEASLPGLSQAVAGGAVQPDEEQEFRAASAPSAPWSRGAWRGDMNDRFAATSPADMLASPSAGSMGSKNRQACGQTVRSEALLQVHTWWAPVELAVRSRRPQQLEAALRDAHGKVYLRTVRTVRRSQSLRPAERHAVEMEMAARLVRKRAMLGKWLSGMQAIQAAHRARDVDDLEKSLSRWNFSEEDSEIATAKADLERWQSLCITLPAVLHDAVARRDIETIREAKAGLIADGPREMDGMEAAKKLLDRYDAQVKGLKDALASGISKTIADKLSAWEFDEDDSNVIEARGALYSREAQKSSLRSLVASGGASGDQLQKAVAAWNFERDDPDFLVAVEVVEHYNRVAGELQRLTQQRPPDLARIASALTNWPVDFSQEDPVVQDARAVLCRHEDAVRTALAVHNGWMLQRLWAAANQGRALPGADDTLKAEVTQELHNYAGAAAALRQAVREAEGLVPTSDPAEAKVELARLVKQWSFAREDVNLEFAEMFQRLRRAGARAYYMNAEGTHGDQAAAEDLNRGIFARAVEAAGALALGLQPETLRVAGERVSALDRAATRVSREVETMDARWFADLKTLTRPHLLVHGILEVVLHILAGIHMGIREPPRDTDWRTCQRMLSDTNSFLGELQSVPDWVHSGHTASIARAQAVFELHKDEFGTLRWSYEGIRTYSGAAAHLFLYVERVFDYAHLLSAEVREAEDLHELDGKRTRGWSVSESKAIDLARERAVDKTAIQRRPGPASKSRTTPFRSDDIEDDEPEELDRSLTHHHIERPSMIEADPAPKPLTPLDLLEQARDHIGKSDVLATSWIVGGGGFTEVQACLDQARRRACAARAVALVADQVHKTMTTWLPDDVEAVNNTSTSCRLDATAHASGSSTPIQSEGSRESSRIEPGEVLTLSKASQGLLNSLEVAIAAVEALNVEANDAGSPPASPGTGERSEKLSSLARSGGAGPANERAKPPAQLSMVGTEAAVLLLNGFSGGDELRPPQQHKTSLVRGLEHPPTPTHSQTGIAPKHRPRSLKADMLEALNAALEVVRQRSGTAGPRASPETENQGLKGLKLSLEPTQLGKAQIRSLRIPVNNLSAAVQVLKQSGPTAVSAGEGIALPAPSTAVRFFVEAMQRFYEEFAPQRAHLANARTAAEEAERDLRGTEEVAALANAVTRMDESPSCTNAEDVAEAAATVAKQVCFMANKGLGLPFMHIEYVRQAIDSAGIVLLSSPPTADSGSRLLWLEAAIALQIAPVPHLGHALSGIARTLASEDLAALGQTREPPTSECVRLFAAAIWVIQPECKKDAGWTEIRRVALFNADAFVQRLIDWQPVQDCATSASLTRARELLSEAWIWVATGCGGNRALCKLFAWVSLAMAMQPLIEMAQQLAPVHRQVKRGLERIRQAPPEQQPQVKAKAWTAALFLLDGPGEPWWWLRLIRPAAEREPPWTDSVDGGLGARAPAAAARSSKAEANPEPEGGSRGRQPRSPLATVGTTSSGPTEAQDVEEAVEETVTEAPVLSTEGPKAEDADQPQAETTEPGEATGELEQEAEVGPSVDVEEPKQADEEELAKKEPNNEGSALTPTPESAPLPSPKVVAAAASHVVNAGAASAKQAACLASTTAAAGVSTAAEGGKKAVTTAAAGVTSAAAQVTSAAAGVTSAAAGVTSAAAGVSNIATGAVGGLKSFGMKGLKAFGRS